MGQAYEDKVLRKHLRDVRKAMEGVAVPPLAVVHWRLFMARVEVLEQDAHALEQRRAADRERSRRRAQATSPPHPR